MTPSDPRDRAEAELEAARSARASGREGRARVCARRAAGVAAAVYLERRGAAGQGGSALDRLRRFQLSPETPDTLRRAAARLTARVDEDFRLPQPQDPLEDARLLVEALLIDD